MQHIICFSGGIGSWATAKRVIEAEGGADDVTLLFADVKGDNDSPHLGEDEDTYRFIADTAFDFGARLVTLNEGRSIWQVFKDKRFLGNSRQANCSHLLKQAPTKKWLMENCDPADTTVYVGISWDEIHRLPAIENAYKSFGFTVKAPLCDPPYVDKQALLEECRADGIEPPRAYTLGFPHNNCGGFCVRAGQTQFRLLLERNRERFMFHEAQEQELREYLGKEVTILTETVKNNPVPLTLRAFRERQEAQPGLFDLDDFDFGGCGCFTETVPCDG